MTLPHNQINPKINNLLDAVEKTGNFKIIQDYNKGHIQNKTCSNCEQKVNPFTFKEIDKKEYFISGLCNLCQPYFFFEGEAI
tara:strand:+ start:773 stop:1018 length:246 start_codon:yes stop_codon:yes gene_type:complete